MPNEASLPRWAQDELARLRRKVSELDGRIEELTTPASEDAGTISHTRGIDAPVAIPRHDRVTFHLGQWRFIDFRFTEEADRVEVMASTGLLVESRASNVVRLGLVERPS